MNDNITLLEKKAAELGCEIIKNEPLSRHTTFKIGGNCRLMVVPKDEQSCCELVKQAEECNIDYFILGNGSNILCSDNGYEGVIFLMSKPFGKVYLEDEKTICAGSGASLAKVCLYALENSLTGLEFAYGIPGTVGGAVYMNAGAYGGEIGIITIEVRAVDKNGNIRILKPDKLEFGYRKSIFQSNEFVILSAKFRLEKGDREDILAKMNELMDKRRDKQPLEYPNAGSTFKRPEGQFAGKLIEDCGLRGFEIGGAQVSSKHCGFIINKGNATFDDVIKLIEHIKKTVLQQTGYHLECEVRILGS